MKEEIGKRKEPEDRSNHGVGVRNAMRDLERKHPLVAHKVKAQEHMNKKTSQEFIERSIRNIKEHELPHWKQD